MKIMKDDTPQTELSYEDAMHAVQTGVSYEQARNPADGTPKHLRVGVNSALINDAALVRLLVKKGILTWEEYAEEVRLEACREVDRYEERIALLYQTKVTLR